MIHSAVPPELPDPVETPSQQHTRRRIIAYAVLPTPLHPPEKRQVAMKRIIVLAV
jgi:hypothetical protein